MFCLHKYKPLVIIDPDGHFDYGVALTKQVCVKCKKVRHKINDRDSISIEYSKKKAELIDKKGDNNDLS